MNRTIHHSRPHTQSRWSWDQVCWSTTMVTDPTHSCVLSYTHFYFDLVCMHSSIVVSSNRVMTKWRMSTRISSFLMLCRRVGDDSHDSSCYTCVDVLSSTNCRFVVPPLSSARLPSSSSRRRPSVRLSSVCLPSVVVGPLVCLPSVIVGPLICLPFIVVSLSSVRRFTFPSSSVCRFVFIHGFVFTPSLLLLLLLSYI